MTASLPPDWEPSTAASSSAPPPAQGRPPGDPGEVGKEIGVKNAGMGQGASEELEPPPYLYHSPGPPAGKFPPPAEWPAEEKMGGGEVERKGGGQGTRANGHELCSGETGILDTLQPDSNPSEEPRV